MGIENVKKESVIFKQVVTIDGFIKAAGLELSLAGLFIQTGRNFTAGTTVGVTMMLDGESMSVHANVQNAKEAIGVGLQFIDLTPSQKQTIEKYVNSRIEHPAAVAEKKVMIVDDSPTVRRANKSKLIEDGFAVVEAGDGMEAIALLAKENIKLVILDLTMERLDGYKVLLMMKQKPEWNKIPVIVLSGRSSAEDMDKALGAGATEFLNKLTTSPSKLSDRVKIHLFSKS
jgi:twitching motility two-component system response regulator PilG